MFESIYNIDLNKWVAELLPINKRKPKFIHWLQALVFPVQELLTQFSNYRDATNYKIDYTSQTFSIEAVLNDAFDMAQRRIYIRDGNYIFPVWFYDRADNKPVFFFDRAQNQPVRFYDRETLKQLDVDFTIVLPKSMNLSNAETIRLRALVDFYRLPDKRYTLEYE